MKLFISLGNPDIISGYVNIDPIVAQNGGNKIPADPGKLDDYVDNGECSEVLASDVWDYYPLTLKPALADHWLGKLGHGGVITVGGLETNEVARAIYLRSLPTDQVNGVLYGTILPRRSTLTVSEAAEFFESKSDYTVISKKVNGLYYLVTARRN